MERKLSLNNSLFISLYDVIKILIEIIEKDKLMNRYNMLTGNKLLTI